MALRRTHLDPLIKRISENRKYDNGSDGIASYYFFDVNVKLHHRFSAKDQLFLSFYKGKDDYNDRDYYEYEDFEFGDFFYYDRDQNLSWGNQITALRWNHLFNEQLFANTTFTFSKYDYGSTNYDYYYDEIATDIGPDIIDEFIYTTFQSKIQDVGLKIDLEYYPSTSHQFLFGGSILYRGFKSGELEVFEDNTTEDSSIEEIEEIIDEFFIPPLFNATELDLYLEDRWAISKQLSLLMGIRLAGFVTNQKTYFKPQPRFNLRWNFQPKWTTNFSISKMSQFLHILSTTGSSLPNDLWVPSTKNVAPQSAWQVAWNTNYQTPNGWKGSVDLFHKKLDHLINYSTGAELPGLLEFDPTFWEEEITFGKGKSYGISTTLEKNKGNFTGQINYAYTLSERQFEDINNNQPYPFRYNHPHEVKIGLKYQINSIAAFNLNWQYGSGQSISLVKTDTPFSPLSNLFPNDLERIGSVNGYRLPAYHRLDLGFYFQWKQPKFTHHLNIGIYNIYNRQNPYFVYKYEDEFFPEDSGLQQQNALPLFPSLSYRIAF